CLIGGVTASVLMFKPFPGFDIRAEDTGIFTPSDNPNEPIGTARGIFPGRVAWAYDSSACTWDGRSNYWWSEKFNDQTKISALLEKTVCSVAGKNTVAEAWDTLFKYYNKNGNGYVAGEKIAIKLNLNNGGNSNAIDASPQSVYALLDQLVNSYGVQQRDIILCDPARENKITAVKNYCMKIFPDVKYNTNLGGFTQSLKLAKNNANERSLSNAIISSKYLITLAILKRHCTPSRTWGTDGVDYGNASVTLIFKSSWGIIGSRRSSMHPLLHDWKTGMNSYSVLTDIYASKHIDGKTVLCILDGLYSGDRWNSKPRKWSIAPFNNHYPSSMFASQDPVALESVGLDFLNAEMDLFRNADLTLHEAAQADNPPSGIQYQPDGQKVSSLGVHEHWNNKFDKKYSRNLGTGNGIELINCNEITKVKPIQNISTPSIHQTSKTVEYNLKGQVIKMGSLNNGNKTARSKGFYIKNNSVSSERSVEVE
ncbi:MAG: DUF362 domain-containing protein, partial [Fibrobacter sp.]|nr:DUF362 domain-containing protein [Fibrobacter sp.]